MLRRPFWIPQPLGQIHPALHPIARKLRNLERSFELKFDRRVYASSIHMGKFAYRVKKHQSVLVRRYPGVDIEPQLNKVKNLQLVIAMLDGLLICRQQTFSFCKSVGPPTAERGFREAIELVSGRARLGVGGGICQASNLIFWLALHSPLSVVERHHHSFDPFPDAGRVLPFASGATVMYKYRDLRLYNPTPASFQLRLWLDGKCLNGDLRCDRKLRYSYSVFEKAHRFERFGKQWIRSNELWRRVIDKESGGHTVSEEFLAANRAMVMYEPNPDKLTALASVD